MTELWLVNLFYLFVEIKQKIAKHNNKFKDHYIRQRAGQGQQKIVKKTTTQSNHIGKMAEAGAMFYIHIKQRFLDS